MSKIVLTFNEFDVEYHYQCAYDALKASALCCSSFRSAAFSGFCYPIFYSFVHFIRSSINKITGKNQITIEQWIARHKVELTAAHKFTDILVTTEPKVTRKVHTFNSTFKKQRVS